LSSGESVDTTSDVVLTAITVYPTGSFSLALDTTLTPYSQGVYEPSTGILLASMKFRAQREDMKLTSLVLTSDVTGATDSAVTSVTLYDADGTTQLSYPISLSATAGTFTLGASDLINPVVFQKDVYKTVFIKGNPVTTAADYFVKIAATGDISLTGVDSQVAATGSITNFYNSLQGKFTFAASVLEIKKNSTSPSGTVARGTVQTYAIWDFTNPTASNMSVTSLTFTSKSGLPSAATNTQFRLVDENDTVVASLAATSTAMSGGTIVFPAGTLTGNVFTIPAASSKSLKLQVNTTNVTTWPLGTQMQWTIAAASHVVGATAGYAGTVWSIPADTNIVTLP